MHNIQPLIDRIEATVRSHQLEQRGQFCRWLWQDLEKSRQLGINEYGCADAANILYSINRFPSDPAERADWVSALQSLQHADTGMFVEPTHHAIHCTAHCTAALELFDARPLHQLKDLTPFRSQAGLYEFLENLPWKSDPWNASHRGAGLYAALVLKGEVDAQWQDWYFGWLWEEADPITGFWRKGCVEPNAKGSIFPHLAGTFHYLFNHEYARRPLHYPDRMIDSCLEIFKEDAYMFKGVYFADVDWIYCLTRSLRQCGHRFAECRKALRQMADQYIELLSPIDPIKNDNWNDLHCLFGATCALAELQQTLPGYLQTDRPLRLVLDRRPFI